jgi:BASS family bile acid:Na+ symporter
LFLLVCVLIPTTAGILLRALLGDRRAAAIRPWLKTINAVNLLILCYSNAAAALPRALSQPDWDFLLAIVGVTGSLCVVAFASGWILGRSLGIEAKARTSLMFGLGMNNNGTGLMLASIALSGHPDVMLPVIAYNLIQQVVAASVGMWRGRARPAL